MKALSFLQPWCWAIFTQGKRVENRGWALPHWMDGKRVIIHASKGWDKGGYEFLLTLHEQGKIERPPDTCPRGALVGECTLRGCRLFSPEQLALTETQNSQAMWEFGDYVWDIHDVIQYKEPVPFRGALGFFNVPNEIVAASEGRVKLLFLDIDGVLNRHERHPNGVCGMCAECVTNLNIILNALPDLQLVISSAWRYYLHSGYMTSEGFEMLLQTHGVSCYKRIHGFTRADDRTFQIPGERPLTEEEIAEWHEYGLNERAKQIADYLAMVPGARFAVVDDLELQCDNLFLTHRDIGLTNRIAHDIIWHLAGEI